MDEDSQQRHERTQHPPYPWRKLAEGGVRKGYDQLVDTEPPPVPMSPQDAVAAAEPKPDGNE